MNETRPAQMILSGLTAYCSFCRVEVEVERVDVPASSVACPQCRTPFGRWADLKRRLRARFDQERPPCAAATILDPDDRPEIGAVHDEP